MVNNSYSDKQLLFSTQSIVYRNLSLTIADSMFSGMNFEQGSMFTLYHNFQMFSIENCSFLQNGGQILELAPSNVKD